MSQDLIPYGPQEVARAAKVAENYRFSLHGGLSDEERMFCGVCGFSSSLDGTLVFAWARRRAEVEPIAVELCEICNAAAGWPRANAED